MWPRMPTLAEDERYVALYQAIGPTGFNPEAEDDEVQQWEAARRPGYPDQFAVRVVINGHPLIGIINLFDPFDGQGELRLPVSCFTDGSVQGAVEANQKVVGNPRGRNQAAVIEALGLRYLAHYGGIEVGWAGYGNQSTDENEVITVGRPLSLGRPIIRTSTDQERDARFVVFAMKVAHDIGIDIPGTQITQAPYQVLARTNA